MLKKEIEHVLRLGYQRNFLCASRQAALTRAETELAEAEDLNRFHRTRSIRVFFGLSSDDLKDRLLSVGYFRHVAPSCWAPERNHYAARIFRFDETAGQYAWILPNPLSR